MPCIGNQTNILPSDIYVFHFCKKILKLPCTLRTYSLCKLHKNYVVSLSPTFLPQLQTNQKSLCQKAPNPSSFYKLCNNIRFGVQYLDFFVERWSIIITYFLPAFNWPQSLQYHSRALETSRKTSVTAMVDEGRRRIDGQADRYVFMWSQTMLRNLQNFMNLMSIEL